MTGPAVGVLHVTPETVAHLHDLERDLAHEHAELCAYQEALAEIVEAADIVDTYYADGQVSAYVALHSLIRTIRRAVPGPSDPGSPS